MNCAIPLLFVSSLCNASIATFGNTRLNLGINSLTTSILGDAKQTLFPWAKARSRPKNNISVFPAPVTAQINRCSLFSTALTISLAAYCWASDKVLSHLSDSFISGHSRSEEHTSELLY